MPQFEFHLDKKVTSWYRETHYVDADTLQEAQKIMIENFAQGDTDETFDSQEEIHGMHLHQKTMVVNLPKKYGAKKACCSLLIT
jgi:hypothetical protein